MIINNNNYFHIRQNVHRLTVVDINQSECKNFNHSISDCITFLQNKTSNWGYPFSFSTSIHLIAVITDKNNEWLKITWIST